MLIYTLRFKYKVECRHPLRNRILSKEISIILNATKEADIIWSIELYADESGKCNIRIVILSPIVLMRQNNSIILLRTVIFQLFFCWNVIKVLNIVSFWSVIDSFLTYVFGINYLILLKNQKSATKRGLSKSQWLFEKFGVSVTFEKFLKK